MRSLKQTLTQQSLLFRDLGDRHPFPGNISKQNNENRNDSNFFEKISNAIKSNNHHLILWALSLFPKACAADKKCMQLIPNIIFLFHHNLPTMEYAAITCARDLARSLGKIVAAPLLSPIIDRMENNPAIEYAECLSIILPFFTKESFQSCILPHILNLISRDDIAYHFTVGEIFVNSSAENFHITSEQFLKIISSKVIAENYLDQIIRSTRKCFNGEWETKVLPSLLMQNFRSNPELRSGYIKNILNLKDIFTPQVYFTFVIEGFKWAEENEEIATNLLLKSQNIIELKSSIILPLIKKTLFMVTKSTNIETLIKLPKIICENLSIFVEMDTKNNGHLGGFDSSQILSNIGFNKDAKVRKAVMTEFVSLLIYAQHYPSISNTLFQIYANQLNDPIQEILDDLCNPVIFTMVDTKFLVEITPVLFSMMASIKQWRIFRKAISIISSLPRNAIIKCWQDIFYISVDKLCESRALLPTFVEFIECLSNFFQDYKELMVLFGLIITSFGTNQSAKMREMFPQVSTAFFLYKHCQGIVEILWKEMIKLSDDQFSSVRANVLKKIPKFKLYFMRKELYELEKEANALFQKLGEDEDPFVCAMWNETKKDMADLSQLVPAKTDITIENSQSNNKAILLSQIPNQTKGSTPLLPVLGSKSTKFVKVTRNNVQTRRVVRKSTSKVPLSKPKMLSPSPVSFGSTIKEITCLPMISSHLNMGQ
ncbi:hypothetical protein TRFO_01302 [Tritrichomonas foetus]|uniref:Uncharacterized protein n=1 Tax=Tritrichomonas foetus TaxID=1144522 RepID=A0A1J4K7J6_9EUKA|nr:hypothetical protein TRFO_01302 [Tritrichomonas foetus]|eukprot:OHT07171.1 hypothetical protein TRFO_01302 [Tritrichomonas foetus]